MFDEKLRVRKRLTLGADPEIFAFKNGTLMPAFQFLPPMGEGRLMYWDGFQAEWKYNQAWTCQNNLVKHTRESLMTMTEHARQVGAKLSLINVVRIPEQVLETAHPKHVELGCDPSYNVYKLKGKQIDDPRKLRYRFAGGHMHNGVWTRKPNYEKIVKTIDKILGVWSVGVAQVLDSPVRRQYYGMPGEYRKPMYGVNEYGRALYGIEYRTLSNFWLSNPPLMQVTWDIERMCVKLAGTEYEKLWAASQDEVVETILNCDVDQAKKILKRNEPMFKWIVGHQRTYDAKAMRQALEISYKGMHEFVGDVHDIPTNWHFKDEWVPNAGADWARFGV
jgi:hypothetical protein